MKSRKRSAKGAALAEMAAALCVTVPTMVLIIFVTLEVSRAYFLREVLAQTARQGARSLAIAYGQQPGLANSRTLQNAMVFDNIRVNNVINSSAQFDDPVFDTASDPPTVKVNVRYTSDRYGLPAFPSPDPLKLGSNFVLSAESTYRLE